MFEAARVSDNSAAPADAHDCPACPHSVAGPGTSGSDDVFVNGLAALRAGDIGDHSSCCGPNYWIVAGGSPAVFVNGKPAARKGDRVEHCGGRGQLISGSSDVFIGDVVQRKPSASKHASLAGLVAVGAKFVFELPNGFIPALGAAVGEALPLIVFKGFPSGVFALLGKTMPGWVDAVLTGLAGATWIALHVIEYHGKSLMGYAKWYFTNVLDNLFDGGDRAGRDECPAYSEPPPPPFILETKELISSAWADAAPRDVTSKFEQILRYYQPLEYQYADDQYPISLPQLIRHAELIVRGQTKLSYPSEGDVELLAAYVNATKHLSEDDTQSDKPARERSAYVDIDDEYARRTGPDGSAATVYGRVVREAPGQLRLDYVHIRAGSFLPTKELYDESFLHEGDGESAALFIRVSESGVCAIDSTRTGGHGHEVNCRQIMFEPAPAPKDGEPDPGRHVRPTIFIAHGSHAIAPTPGKRAAGGGSTDWFPPRQRGAQVVVLLPILVTAAEEHVREAVFTHRVVWGSQVGSHGGHRAVDPE